MASHTNFLGVPTYGTAMISENLEKNLVSFLQWSLLGAGAFNNVTLNGSGAYGGNYSHLRLADFDSSNSIYSKGQVWEGIRQDWVWESGIENSTQPIPISGVYVNNVFHPTTGVGPYAHHINYPMGRVIFDSPINVNSTVKCEHTFRFVHVTHSDVGWWRDIQFNSLRADDPQIYQYSSGSWSIGAENRIQLPAIVVEVLPRVAQQGFEIGNLVKTTFKDAFFHILTEDTFNRKQLTDILTYQQEHTIFGYDLDKVISDGKQPLDSEGTPISGAMMYPQLVQPSDQGGYAKKQIIFSKVSGEGQQSRLPFYYSIIRVTFEVKTPY